jgi:ADP-ribosyl-[dinitrogen reductase] hydrolase
LTISDAVIADRSAGVVLAAAAGDALGAPHEFLRPMDGTVPLRMTGGGTYGWKPGEWTDDTQMTLALLTPLAAGDRRIDAVEEGLLAWYASRPRDVGTHTGSVLRAGAPLHGAAAAFQRLHPDNSPNGGLMRIGAAALAFPRRPEQIEHYARATTSLTHAHIDCLDASVIWAVAIDDTIHSAPGPDDPWDFAKALRKALSQVPKARRQWWTQLIDEACERPPVYFHRNNSWVTHAFQGALSAIMHAQVPPGRAACTHLVAAIETAVRSGGDTDTVAATAGALVGARWGATAVPLAWTSMLRGKRLINRPDLHAFDLDMLARRAAVGGRADKLGWPGVAQLVPYYIEKFGKGSATVELGGVQFGAAGGIAHALDAGADVVVSLCRMGIKDVPARVEHRVIGLLDTNPDDNPNLAFLLADTADFIAAREAEKHSVYVHCVVAENRTPIVAATFLARHRGMSFDAALKTAEQALHASVRPFLVEGGRRAAAL